jgi:hydrogenase 3 maturation protease
VTDTDKLRGALEKLRGSRTVILGIGNTLKGDDAAGPAVCEGLSRESVAADVIDAGTVPENYIGRVIKLAPEYLVIVDAVDLGADPGSIEILDISRIAGISVSTHAPSAGLFLDMIRAETGCEVLFIAIQPAGLGTGEGLSEEAGRAVKTVVSALVDIF